jgi:hypothetical protein
MSNTPAVGSLRERGGSPFDVLGIGPCRLMGTNSNGCILAGGKTRGGRVLYSSFRQVHGLDIFSRLWWPEQLHCRSKFMTLPEAWSLAV